MHDVRPAQLTPARLLNCVPAGVGTLVLIHRDPVQRAPNATEPERPTARQLLATRHDTAKSAVDSERDAGGAATMRQRRPSQRSASDTPRPERRTWVPTATHDRRDTHDTENSCAVAADGFSVRM